MTTVERVAVALARERYRRNMDRQPPLTDDEILRAVSVSGESYAALLDEARAAIAAYELAQAEPEEPAGRTVRHTLDFETGKVTSDVMYDARDREEDAG